MFDKQRDIDAVVIATPDHLHAVAAYVAMKAGKHVYVQKPLTYTVQEARLLARTARETKVVTQMGNQGHSMEGTRRINELIAAGVLGPIREVHMWTDRPARFWAQGIPRPATRRSPRPRRPPIRTCRRGGACARSTMRCSRAMAADPQTRARWRELGSLPRPHDAPDRVSSGLSSVQLARLVDFGVSAIGDMGAHIVDQPFWALGLDYPTSIIASSTPWGGRPRIRGRIRRDGLRATSSPRAATNRRCA